MSGVVLDEVKNLDEVVTVLTETEGALIDWLDGDEVRLSDDDGDTLVIQPSQEEDGTRYFGVLRNVPGEEGKTYLQGVLLTPEQQATLVETVLGYDPSEPVSKSRVRAARKAASILRAISHGGIFGQGQSSSEIKAEEVIKLAAWIMDGEQW